MNITLGKLNIEFNFNINFEKPYMRQVKNALREGRRLLAVKIYKDATGLGLRESKEAVDKLLPKYYSDYKPNPNCESSNAGAIPDVQTFYQPKPMFGACKASTDLFSNIMNPQPLFVGTLDQCQKWANDNRMVCTMIALNQDEVNKYIRNKLTQRNEVPNLEAEETKYRFTHGVYIAGESKPEFIGTYIECTKYVSGVKAYDESDDPTLPKLNYREYYTKPLNESQLIHYNSQR